MKLFTNGCSFTWGGAICPSLWDEHGNNLDWENSSEVNQQRIRSVWPYHLSQHLNVEHVNLSMGSGSNERIVRTTLDYFTNLISNGQYKHEWIAIIQWTQSPRFEFWDEIAQCWAMCLPTGSTTSIETKYKHQQYNDRFQNTYYRFCNNKTYSQKYFQQVIGLSCFFDKHNIKYWFTNLDRTVFSQLEPAQQQYLSTHVSWLDTAKHNFDSLFVDKTSSNHPSLVGHQQIAHNIYNIIKNQID